MNLKHLFGEYLEHSIRYYIFDRPVVSDAYFDNLCKTLLANWGDVDHKFKHLCDESALAAGTGFQLQHSAPHAIIALVTKYPDTPLKEVFKENQDESRCN